ncbi:hypothetical protein IMZ31_18820 (plasmid) [Pontibacillus sp. ALD_SL1]|uniref:hypothetical protein n=1 Tax=Pontibacillus sp. ALD_SL1 TaxID=2777185 RepID=UPI001A965ABF|nr:hypothetical protein [Pontibacillus sp. ALD_SL1]QST02602.1 hypothetical protein IMZ31_18820 [Pontibacillus sp. ALD_SL1]
MKMKKKWVSLTLAAMLLIGGGSVYAKTQWGVGLSSLMERITDLFKEETTNDMAKKETETINSMEMMVDENVDGAVDDLLQFKEQTILNAGEEVDQYAAALESEVLNGITYYKDDIKREITAITEEETEKMKENLRNRLEKKLEAKLKTTFDLGGE